MRDLYITSDPLVSIIIPTFNRMHLISRAVDSIINQSYKKWELIIIDDGSSDKTFEVVNKFLKMDNIIYRKHSNRGVAISMNAGIQNTTGEIVTFLGSDDEYKKDHLLKRVKIFEENPEIDIIHGGAEIIGNPFVKDKNNLNKTIHLNECVLGGTLFVKRQVLIELNGFKNIVYSAESDLIERAQNKFKIKKVDFPTYFYYRDNSDSICNNI